MAASSSSILSFISGLALKQQPVLGFVPSSCKRRQPTVSLHTIKEETGVSNDSDLEITYVRLSNRVGDNDSLVDHNYCSNGSSGFRASLTPSSLPPIPASNLPSLGFTTGEEGQPKKSFKGRKVDKDCQDIIKCVYHYFAKNRKHITLRGAVVDLTSQATGVSRRTIFRALKTKQSDQKKPSKKTKQGNLKKQPGDSHIQSEADRALAAIMPHESRNEMQIVSRAQTYA